MHAFGTALVLFVESICSYITLVSSLKYIFLYSILLIKTGIAKTHEHIYELYYGISQEDVIWVLNWCAICAQNSANNSAPAITPIVSARVFDRVQIDLMDMQSTADGIYHWILQWKCQFSCQVELDALEGKMSAEIASKARCFFSCYGYPSKL